MKKILLMLCVLACVTGWSKKEQIEESKVMENQPEVVQENIKKDNKYKRVTSISDEHIAYINSI